MNTSHTPAPWKAHKTPNDPDFTNINAELLEALKLIASCESRFAGDVVDIAKKAVLKATGEQA